MTLRARLTLAFMVVLLGPVLIAGWAVTHALRPGQPPDPPTGALRAVVATECQHLQATADGLAVIAAARGKSWLVTPAPVAGAWAICGSSPPRGAPATGPAQVRALAARAEIRGSGGEVTGYAYAVRPIDSTYLGQISAAAGRPVSLAPVDAGLVDAGLVDVGVVNAGPVNAGPVDAGLVDAGPADTGLVDAGPADTGLVVAAPPLWLSLEPVNAPAHAAGTGPVLALAGVALAVSLALAWWLAGLVIRPLDVLLAAVDRAAGGDLESRSRISGGDETGRLGRRLDALISRLQETQRLSVTDPLTGLGNLRHLRESLRREVERASRFHRSLGVLVLDLDHFKVINDTYGHRVGDDALVEFARRIRGVVREVDLAFRHGGEEFAILLPETDTTGSLTVARRIGSAMRERPFPVRPRYPGGASQRGGGASQRGGASRHHPGEAEAVAITVSIGIAVFPRHAETGAEVLEAADEALYRAKAAGRDQSVMARSRLPEARAAPTTPRAGPIAQCGDHRDDAAGASAGTVAPRPPTGG